MPHREYMNNLKPVRSRLKDSHFSRPQLLLFAIVFGLVGILIWKSLAAPNPALPGDLNNDNKVDVSDLSVLLSNFGSTTTSSLSTADITGDGHIDVLDLSALLSHFGQSLSVLAKPSIPTGLTATPGDGKVTLNWNANSSGEQVDTYQVYLNGTSYNLSVAGTSFIVASLTNGTSYDFRVSAHNSAGYGGWSDAITATPQGSGGGGGTGTLLKFGSFDSGNLSEFGDTTCHSEKVAVHVGGGPNNTNWARFTSTDSTQCYSDTDHARVHMLQFKAGNQTWFNNGKTVWMAMSQRVPSGFVIPGALFGGLEIHGDNGTGTAPSHIGIRNGQWNVNAAGADAAEFANHAFAQWNFGGHYSTDQVVGGKDYRKQADWVGGNHTVVRDEWMHFRIGMHFDYTNNNGVGNGWYEAWARWGNMTSWLNIVPRVSNIPFGTTDPDGNGYTLYPILSLYYDVGAGGTVALDYADGAFSDDLTTLTNWQNARLGF
jgi:hypothetical protein